MNVLELSHVSKSFGSKKVLNDLNFCVPEHVIFGFIGKNGAGKTTTMQMICGLIPIDQGEIFVCGDPVSFGSSKGNAHIGYLPDVHQFYDFMTPREYLTLCGQISQIPKDILTKRIESYLDMVQLLPDRQKIKGFSRGMKQRLGIVQALLNHPKLLICDEPTSALDPVGRKEILDILMTIKEHTTVLFSTHILSDVERICDHTALLHQGKIQFLKTREEMKSLQKEADLEVWFRTPEDLTKFQSEFPGGKPTGSHSLLFSQKDETYILLLMESLVRQQIAVEKIERMEYSLEDLFFETIGNGGKSS